MGTFSIWHWIIVLIIVVLVFGTKKLRNLGGDLGNAIKGFKDGMKESETEKTASQSTHFDNQIIEVEARKEASVNTFKNNTKEEPSGNASVPPTINKTTSENNAVQRTSPNSQVTEAESKEKTQVKT